jgi:hypothetical protein
VSGFLDPFYRNSFLEVYSVYHAVDSWTSYVDWTRPTGSQSLSPVLCTFRFPHGFTCMYVSPTTSPRPTRTYSVRLCRTYILLSICKCASYLSFVEITYSIHTVKRGVILSTRGHRLLHSCRHRIQVLLRTQYSTSPTFSCRKSSTRTFPLIEGHYAHE